MVKILDAVKVPLAASASKIEADGEWTYIANGVTDVTGEVHNLVAEQGFTAGVYRVDFNTEAYWEAQGYTPTPTPDSGRISTLSAWVLILEDIKGAHRVLDLRSEDGTKQEAMDTCFQLMFYGFKYKGVAKQLFNVNITTLFLAMAKYIKRFHLRPSQFLQTLAQEQRALLTVLEASVGVVDVKHHKDLLKTESQFVLYVLHRLLDHGQARELIIYGLNPAMLTWILQDRRSRNACQQHPASQVYRSSSVVNPTAAAGDRNTRPADDDLETEAPCKRPKLDVTIRPREARSPVEPEMLCRAFALSGSCLTGSCPRGKICSLQIRECGQSTLDVLVPLVPTWLCLRSLTIQSCWIFRVAEVQLLARSLKQLWQTSRSSLVDLSVAVLPQTALVEQLLDACPGLRSLSLEIHPMDVDPVPRQPTDLPELSLQTLSVKVPQVLADFRSITAVLKHSPHLASLHISGIRLPTSSSYRNLLRTISAELVFLSPDSSNFIQPAELLELGQRLRTHPPPSRLTLDLRKNPWDRDQETWRDARRTLGSLCDLLTDGWKSRNTMADHISNM
ncbi:hypothetical protein NHX12_033633 [Muraenolepis orangiensis]|uniref:Leucine-rich repeat-containing protein 41 n=1 Tax=Muraenolepis orangiensis TaxID=630683 RepID=A0A9Q0E2P8_9TELE|nr:hypothetical protein NHX12_033633 [Muraenolepis orangiensis]